MHVIYILNKYVYILNVIYKNYILNKYIKDVGIYIPFTWYNQLQVLVLHEAQRGRQFTKKTNSH